LVFILSLGGEQHGLDGFSNLGASLGDAGADYFERTSSRSMPMKLRPVFELAEQMREAGIDAEPSLPVGPCGGHRLCGSFAKLHSTQPNTWAQTTACCTDLTSGAAGSADIGSRPL
jgi:hypothetical protein